MVAREAIPGANFLKGRVQPQGFRASAGSGSMACQKEPQSTHKQAFREMEEEAREPEMF